MPAFTSGSFRLVNVCSRIAVNASPSRSMSGRAIGSGPAPPIVAACTKGKCASSRKLSTSSAALDGTRMAGMTTVAMSSPAGSDGSTGNGARGVRGESQISPPCSATAAGRSSVALAGIDASSSSAGINVQVPSAA